MKKHLTLHKFSSIILLLMVAFFAQAQEELVLDLPTALKMAGANNLTMEMMQTKEALAAAEYDLSKNWWLPELYAGVDVHQLWGNAMNTDGNILTDLDRQYISGAVGINAVFDFKEGRRQKKLMQYKTQSGSVMSQIDRNGYLLEVVKVYHQLLSTSLEVAAYQRLIIQSDSIIQQLEILVREGLQYNTDLLLAKSNQENQRFQLYEAQLNGSRLTSELLTLLHRDSDSQLVLSETQLVPVELVSEADIAGAAIQSAPEFKFLQIQQAAKAYERNNTKNGFLMPIIRVNAYTSLFGDIFEDILPTNAINGGIGWKIPLTRFTGDDLKVVDLQKTLLDQEVSLLQQKTKQTIQRLQAQSKLLKDQIQSTESAIESANLALGETIERQQLGLARPFEIELAQQAFIRSRINYLKAVANYNVAQYDLFVKLGNNL